MLPSDVLAEIDWLLARLRADEPQALDMLIAKALPHMKRYLVPAGAAPGNELTASQADVLMDAAARAARKFSTFKGTKAPSFLSWLKQIVVRCQIDATRWQGRKKRKLAIGPDNFPAELI